MVLLWVPFLEVEWLEMRDGILRGLGGDGLAIGEETAAHYRAVLGGFTVAVEEVGFQGF